MSMIFATLHITSHDVSQLPKNLFLGEVANDRWSLIEDDWPRKTRRELHRRLGLGAPAVPRYRWTLCSVGVVEDFNPLGHVQWLLSALSPGVKLHQLTELGFDYWLAFACSGNGTGGGASLTEELAQLLVLHSARLDIGFYWTEHS
ncbi:hypothetical protein [Cupriavidus necator]